MVREWRQLQWSRPVEVQRKRVAVSSNAFVAGAVPAGSGLYELLESTPGGEPLHLSGNMSDVILKTESLTGTGAGNS